MQENRRFAIKMHASLLSKVRRSYRGSLDVLCHMNLHLDGALEVLDELLRDTGDVVHLLVLKHGAERRLLHRLCW